MRDEIRLRAGGANARSDLFAGRHLEVRDQALRAVANVFVFLAFDLVSLSGHAWPHRFCGGGALKRLDAGLFIRTHQMRALRVQQWGLCVKIADRFDLLAKLFRIALRRLSQYSIRCGWSSV